MGPGYVPRALAWIILGFGAAFVVTSLLKAREPIPALAWRPLLAILASIALFAVLFSTLGLIAACVGCGRWSAGAATTPVRWRQLIAVRHRARRVLGAAVRQGPRPAVQALAAFWRHLAPIWPW